MKKKIISILCALLIMSGMCTTAFATVGSFKKGYGFDYGYSNIAAEHKSKMGDAFPDLVDTEIDGSVVKANDYILLNNITATELNNFMSYANGIGNVYIWKQDGDGTIRKMYGGGGTFGNFKSYAIPRANATYCLADSNTTTPRIYCRSNDFLGTGMGGAWCIRPGSANSKVTFGRYDLNMKGVNVFTFRFAYNSANGSAPLITAYLTQGENAELEHTPSEYTFSQRELFNIYRGGQLKFFGSGIQAAQLPVNLGWNAADKFITATITVNTLGDNPTALVKFTKGDGTVYAQSEIDNSVAAGFDYSKDMGIKFVMQEYMDITTEVHIGDFTFAKPVNVTDTAYITEASVINESGYALSGNLFAAMYDTEKNDIVSVRSIAIENLPDLDTAKHPITLDNMDKLTNPSKYMVKLFFLSDELEPLGTMVPNALTPTVICE